MSRSETPPPNTVGRLSSLAAIREPSHGDNCREEGPEPYRPAHRCDNCREEGPEPHRPARRQAGADAPHDAFNEPGKAGCRTRPHLPAGAEIRERHQPHRGQPIAANVPYPSGANSVLLRGRAERISATRLQWKRVIDGRD